MITMCNIMQFNITTGISKTIYISNLLFKNRYICLLYHKGALVSLLLSDYYRSRTFSVGNGEVLHLF